MDLPTINTYILTGFLGAGKTTLLNFLLDSKKGELNYIIENEFGKISIDGSLVTKNYEEIFELNNGCVCCSLDGELVGVLSSLSRTEKKPDNLFIEASGIADAGQLAAIFKREDVMEFFNLNQVICMVDAENIEDRLDEVPEIYRQLVAADLILINKTELVQESYLSTLRKLISQINPFANIACSSFGKFDLGLLDHSGEEKNIEKLNKFNLESGHRMKSIAIEVPNEFVKSQLYVKLSMTIFLHYEQLYRIKGYVRLQGEESPVLVQSTGNNVSFTVTTTPSEELPLILVFIGKNIERAVLEKLLMFD
jgi:G3E family GTPase